MVFGGLQEPSTLFFSQQEYLTERSHFRQTGIKTKRYTRGGFVRRNFDEDPPIDGEGKYRPAKPTGWDDAYKDSGPPEWFRGPQSWFKETDT